jgi:hypothetical protein
MTDHEESNDESLDARGRIEEALDGVLDRATLDVLLQEVLASLRHAVTGTTTWSFRTARN